MSDYQLVVDLAWGLVSLVASSHAALYKRDSRALVGWFGVIWLVPFAGAILYWLFGINRIQRRAHVLMKRDPQPAFLPLLPGVDECRQSIGCHPATAHLAGLAELVDRMVARPLLNGNQVRILTNGDETYPRMIEEIDAATASISLCTYIFDGDRAGARMLETLQRAAQRGVAVRLLIDDVGSRYSWPSVVYRIARAGIPVARFLPVHVPRLIQYANLRNHRKIMVVDGRVGFTGGINIREEHCLQLNPRHAIQDVHFRLQGPVVGHLQDTFAKDWYFATRETLSGAAWFPPLEPSGETLARGIADGPDDNFDVLRNVLLGAIASARSSIDIVTPYFLPDSSIIDSLNVAAMRGVAVRIVIPERTNSRLVQWAATAQLGQLLPRGCRVWRSRPPFDHSKLLLIDGQWSFLGSANWDNRSLRLNFEFNVECYDERLTTELAAVVQQKIETGREWSLAEYENRALPQKLRDGFTRVLAPYL